MPGLTVVIPSRSRSNLEPCVNAVRQHEPKCRIVVVWDQSRDNPETVTPCKDYRVVNLFEQFVYARNCNAGIVFAGRDDVVLLNDDALLCTPGGFTHMQEAANECPLIGIIGATTNITGQPLQRPQGIGLRAIPHFAFVCVLIPRRTIDRVGLLDEQYCLDYGVEDRDYCETVRRSGLTCAVDDGCFVDHSQLTSTFRGHPTAPRSFVRNWGLFVEKWGPVAC